MGSGQIRNFYQLLGVEKTATKEQIREAYKELARVYHPDSRFYDEILESVSLPQGETETFKLITEAYNTLSNESARAEYDKSIPGELPDWDDDSRQEWDYDLKAQELARTAAASQGNPTEQRYAGQAFGSFGDVKDHRPRSAFDDEALRSVRPVSEMIKVRRRSLWQWLKWLFFLD